MPERARVARLYTMPREGSLIHYVQRINGTVENEGFGILTRVWSDEGLQDLMTVERESGPPVMLIPEFGDTWTVI